MRKRFRNRNNESDFITYKIKQGDTLWALARRFCVTVEDILMANPGIDPLNLNIGQKITIPVSPPVDCPPNSEEYIIQPGDTFWEIAQRLGVSLDKIKGLNPDVDPDNLQVGQKICIPIPPRPPIIKLPCALSLIRILPELPAEAGGSVLIREVSEQTYPVTFAVSGLPAAEELGDFDTYIASIVIEEELPDPPLIFSILLTRVTANNQLDTWAGTRNLREIPAKTDIAVIRPFKTDDNTAGSILMQTTFEDC